MAKTTETLEFPDRARSLMREERWVDAIKLFKSELSLTVADWRLTWDLGWCYFKLDRFREARKHLIRARKLAPENAICAWGLGSVYNKLGQHRKAEKYLVDALRIKDSHMTRIALAFAYLAQGKLEEAENIHLEGIKLKPKASSRFESYACFLSDVGREREAQSMYQKAKELRGIV
jgi:Flp pilus assembly protein TadD